MLRHKLDLILFFGLAVVSSLVLGGLAGAFAALVVLQQPGGAALLATSPSVSPTVERTSASLTGAVSADDTLVGVVRSTRPAVVTVLNLQYVRTSFFEPAALQPVSSGSGVIFDARGYIATNAHVIDGARELEVVFLDGRQAKAETVRSDASLDVAVLKVSGVPLPAVARLADSSALEPGMRVIAIGSPLGTEYQNTVTTGVVAGLNRRVKHWGLDRETWEVKEQDVVNAPLIQTDAAINAGNSGGPLINLRGEVVGLNTLIVRQDAGNTVEGLGFAIPSNVVRALADEWIDQKWRGWLGASLTTVDPMMAREKNLTRSVGALVDQAWEGGPAARAGLQAGDIVVAIDGAPLDLDHALIDRLWRYRAGQTVRLTVDRAGHETQLSIKLDLYPGAGQ